MGWRIRSSNYDAWSNFYLLHHRDEAGLQKFWRRGVAIVDLLNPLWAIPQMPGHNKNVTLVRLCGCRAYRLPCRMSSTAEIAA
jgi:hypothetical protein